MRVFPIENWTTEISSKTYENYNKVWKKSTGVFCCVFMIMASQSFRKPFERFISQRLVLVHMQHRFYVSYVDNKSNLNLILTHYLRRTLQNLAKICLYGKLSTRLPASSWVRSFLSNSLSLFSTFVFFLGLPENTETYSMCYDRNKNY